MADSVAAMTGAISVPPADYVPAGPERAVAVAHAAQEVLSDIAHAKRHAAAAASAGNPERVAFNLKHVENHIGGAIKQQNSSISNLVQLDQRAGAELAKLRDTTARALSALCPVPGCVTGARAWQYAPPGPARGRTPAHLAQTVLVALTHARQHVLSSQDAPDADNLKFDLEHLISHVDEAIGHQRKYLGAVAEIFPDVAAELGALGELSDLGSTAKSPERSMSMDGQLLLTEMMACGPLSDDEMDELTDGLAAPARNAQAQEAYEATMARFAETSRWGGAI